MEIVQQTTLPYALLIFGLIAVGLVILLICAFAWWLVNRLVSSEVQPPVKIGQQPAAQPRWSKSPRSWSEVFAAWENEKSRRV